MLVQRLNEIGQDHIARLLEKRADFINAAAIEKDLAAMDHGLLKRLLAGEMLFKAPIGRIEPAQVMPVDTAATPAGAHAAELGREILSQGKLAVVVVAGGQGSRLGISGPKGIVPVSPVKGKSLFQIHAEKILALHRRYGGSIPFFIMTSRDNDAETRSFFNAHAYFGLDREDVFFFMQGMLPSVSSEGRFLLDQSGGLFMNPDGHGGTLRALKESGALTAMRSRGIEEIFYFQVDNPLVGVADPLFIGLHHQAGAQMSSKVCRKRDFGEKVGVIALVGGRTTVIEYSDMPDDMRYAVDAQGQMVYWAGSIAIHMLRLDFVERLTAGGVSLPFHRAAKKIPALDEQGRPAEIEGIKFETFIFDALRFAEVSVTLEVRREEEFAPVKNMSGEDSLASCRAMLSALHRSWLEGAGITVGEGVAVEISPLLALTRQDVARCARNLPREICHDVYCE
ncbi:MAG: UDPGP type 1 family protein [Syntrophaceae bacterium]